MMQLPPFDDIRPFFQPIISVQTQHIIGYEALGRNIQHGRVSSLGTFFKSSKYSEAEQVKLDRIIREKAISHLSSSAAKPLLFLNLKPAWIYDYFLETGELLTLKYLNQYNVDGNQIVIEITEEEFKGDLVQLNVIIENYRSAGCLIAIDDVGAGFSSLDRIALIRPNILKIDLHLLRKSQRHQGYLAILRSFSSICDGIGASLLIEGVETISDMQLALDVGARYVQGFLFSEAVPDFLPYDHFTTQVRQELDQFRRAKNDELEMMLRYKSFEQQLMNFAPQWKSSNMDDMLERIHQVLRPECMRMYVCNDKGDQISSNFERDDAGDWVKIAQPPSTNWSWRPYFLMNIYMLKHNNQPFYLSFDYTDINRSALIRTVSYAMGNDCYLFMDIKI